MNLADKSVSILRIKCGVVCCVLISFFKYLSGGKSSKLKMIYIRYIFLIFCVLAIANTQLSDDESQAFPDGNDFQEIGTEVFLNT